MIANIKGRNNIKKKDTSYGIKQPNAGIRISPIEIDTTSSDCLERPAQLNSIARRNESTVFVQMYVIVLTAGYKQTQ